MGRHAPVTDWETDFDHTDSAWTEDPYPIWDQLRQTCPVAHSERYGGTWLPTRHEDISAIAYDTDHFSSHGVVVNDGEPDPEELPAPIGGAPPITSDPPFHSLARRMLLPAFSPKAVNGLRPYTTDMCRSLIAAIDPSKTVDASIDYARHIPVRVIARMLGFPPEDDDKFRQYIKLVLEDVDAGDQTEAFEELDAYLQERVKDHQECPRDDLTSFLLDAELDGNKLEPQHVTGTMLLLMVAGIDTTWSAIGSSIWHLATHPDDLAKLVSGEYPLATAVEEFLRAYAPVTMARKVAVDTEFGGRAMRPGDWVLLPFPAANRDPEMFERADEVVLDRQANRHAAFGLGIHRCLGSNLARMELTIALEEWLSAFPSFTLAPGAEVTWATGQVRGPRTLPLVITQ